MRAGRTKQTIIEKASVEQGECDSLSDKEETNGSSHEPECMRAWTFFLFIFVIPC